MDWKTWIVWMWGLTLAFVAAMVAIVGYARSFDDDPYSDEDLNVPREVAADLTPRARLSDDTTVLPIVDGKARKGTPPVLWPVNN